MNIRYAPSFYLFKQSTYIKTNVLNFLSSFKYYLELSSQTGATTFIENILKWIKIYLNDIGEDVSQFTQSFANDVLNDVNKELVTIVFTKYQDYYFSCVPIDINQDLFYKQLTRYEDGTALPSELKAVIGAVTDLFLNKFIPKYLQTKDRYSTLLSLYENNKNNLLNQLKRVQEDSTIRNDTPVLNVDSNDLSSDQYASDIVKHQSTSQYDVDTIIGRLDEVTRKYRDVLNDWADEFKGMFWGIYDYE